jgi:shikimate dehydrogenase
MVKDKISGLVGIIGYPLGHSLSPPMHNAAFKHLGLDFHYVPFPIKPEDLADGLEGLKSLNMVGCNVTIPYKEHIIPFLDQLDVEAKMLGAVNTIVNRDGMLWGYNTDSSGFLRSLVEDLGFNIAGKKALILGAGGAARAVAFALAKAGIEGMVITNRSFGKGQKLAEDVQGYYPCRVQACLLEPQTLKERLSSAQLLVNTLPLGMYPHVEGMPPIQPEWLEPSLTVCDLIYNPPKTRLLEMAEKQGCTILNGEGMLVYQGAEAFKLWTGQEAPVSIMRNILKQELERQD